MDDQKIIQPDYGNWVSRRLIYIPGIMVLIFLFLSSISSLFLIIAAPFLIIFLYFAYAYHVFTPKGGDIQAKIREFVLNQLNWDGNGRALDIGCGNGALTIELAKKYPEAFVMGIDYWGGKWDYSRDACEKNARIEGVSSRMSFRQTSAADLPFDDGTFDVAVSNFVFHEVKDTHDKREVIREALRVIKKGGVFAFQDLFPHNRLYGDIDDLLDTIRGWGIQDVRFLNTSDAEFIPFVLRLPFMIGKIGIIYGKK